jgi:hypothetical protein
LPPLLPCDSNFLWMREGISLPVWVSICSRSEYSNEEDEMTAEQRKRTRPIPIRFSNGERRLLGEAAEAEHDYLSSYIRRIVLTEIERRTGRRANDDDQN